MKAAVYRGVRSIEVTEKPYPKPSPGQVTIKVALCGICGTDSHSYWQGRPNSDNLVFGHEVVGTVAEVGAGVDYSKIGDRVVVGPPGSCGECYVCQAGQPNLCVHAFEKTCGLSPGVDGGMAEYMRVPYPKTMLVKIPDNVSFEDAVLMDTIAVSFHGIRISHFKMGDDVVVSGAGPIGLAAIEFLKMGGARHITVLQPSPIKRQMALDYGADLGLNPREEGVGLRKKILDLYRGAGPDVVYECAGTPDAFETSMNIVKYGGQIIMLGSTKQNSAINESMFVRPEIEVKGSFVYTKDEISMCLDFISQGRFKTTGMLSDCIKLDDIVEKGYERIAKDKSLIKVAIKP
jgi:2-desacetyl-2-hydroxyethyl bacteriochlorophyllide A dehydrogenase